MPEKSGTGLGESLEDYLEAIWALEREWGAAQVGHISSRLSVSKPSVTGALRALKGRSLIRHEPYGTVTLTQAGKRIARNVARRHGVLKGFLTSVLLLPQGAAETAACRMEHILSESVIERFCAFARYLERCPRGAPRWFAGTGFACPDRDPYSQCEHCSVVGSPAAAKPADANRPRRSSRNGAR